MNWQHPARDFIQKMELEKNEERLQIQLAGALTLHDVKARGTERPRASQSLPVREAAAAAVGLRVLTRQDLYPSPPDGKPRPPRFDLPEWVRRYAPHINAPEAKALVLSFLDLVDACATLPKSGPSDAVVYRHVTDLGSTLGLVSPAAASASPAPGLTVKVGASILPTWTVCKPERYRGYSAPLHRLLAAAHREGLPCPTAREVVEAFRAERPAEIAKVLSEGFDYYDAKGNTKPADLAGIHKAIRRMTNAR